MQTTRFSPFDLHLFHEGTHQRLHEKLGAHVSHGGVHFSTWEPAAGAVSVVGDFNDWAPGAHPLAQLADPAIWEADVPGIGPGARYLFHVDGESRADPFAFACAPGGASLVAEPTHQWHEGAWPHHRHITNALDSPIAICAGDPDSAKQMGFTHLQLPRVTGFAPADGEPSELLTAIDRLHHRGMGAALDLTPPTAGATPEQRAINDSAAVFWTEVYHADLLLHRDLLRDDGWREELYRYLAVDPFYRKQAHHDLIRRMEWAFDDNFILPVLAPPASIPGGDSQRAATVRLLLAWMYALPGKKLLRPFDEPHMPLLVGQLNHLYRTQPALYTSDHSHKGFQWLDASNAEQNVAAFLRRSREGPETLVFVANFSGAAWHNYRVGVPSRGRWRETLNTDAVEYGGSGQGNFGGVDAVPIPLHGEQYSITVTLPPLAGVYFTLER